MAGNVIRKIGHYSLAKVAIMAAGLISYPILTRILEPSEYGVMGIVITILNITIGVSKMGLGTGVVVRLWPEWEKKEHGAARFILTCFLTIILFTILTTLVTNGVTHAIGPWLAHLAAGSGETGRALGYFIHLASPLIAIRALNAYCLAVLQAREWSMARAMFETATSYAAMICAVLGAAVVIGGLQGYYVGLLAGEGVVLIALLVFIFRSTSLRRSNLSRSLFREAVTFGFPIVIYELSGVLFYTGDRFLILWLLDASALGFYTVAFNLANYANVAFGFPVNMAVGPAVTKVYENEGPAAASELLRKVVRYFLMFALAAVAGLTIIREDLLVLLASERFRPGAELVHILLAGLLLATCRDIVGVGMFLKKRPWLMAPLNLTGVALNSLLNLVLIPVLKSMGAALATLISQFTMTCLFWYLGSRLVRVPIDIPVLIKHALCAAAMAVGIYYIDVGPSAVRLLVRLAAGVVIFGGLLILVDRDVRQQAGRLMRRFRS